MSRTKILVATHKPYQFPQSDIYLPIEVGAKLRNQPLSILQDNTDNHISEKNGSFCELTALYWAWKNQFFQDAEYVGLVHYRRYFSGKTCSVQGKNILGENEIVELLENADCIVPKKRNYYIETVRSHYENAHHCEDLAQLEAVIFAKNPDYLTAYHQLMNGRTLHLFNMFVMKKTLCDRYCEWLFPILFELEQRIDISTYSQYQQRIFGFIAERLFNVWLIHNKIKTVEIDVVNVEKENIHLKAINLLKRKFLKNAKQ